MSPDVYRLIHFGGVLLLFLGLGGVIVSSRRDGAKPPGWCLAAHGIGLLAMVVAGVGIMHKSDFAWANWTYAKVGAWLVLGAVPVLMKKGLLPRAVAVVLVVAVGVAAAWLARTKPF